MWSQEDDYEERDRSSEVFFFELKIASEILGQFTSLNTESIPSSDLIYPISLPSATIIQIMRINSAQIALNHNRLYQHAVRIIKMNCNIMLVIAVLACLFNVHGLSVPGKIRRRSYQPRQAAEGAPGGRRR